MTKNLDVDMNPRLSRDEPLLHVTDSGMTHTITPHKLHKQSEQFVLNVQIFISCK